METVAVGPVDAEILLDEIGTVAIHSLRKLDGFTLARATGEQAANLSLKRSIDKHVKRVGARLQVISGAASHNHTVAFLRRFFYNSLGNLTDAIGVHHF